MPIASAILRCAPGCAARIAASSALPALKVEIRAVIDDAIAIVLDEPSREELLANLEACGSMSGVLWVDGVFYSEEDLSPDFDECARPVAFEPRS